MLCIPPKVISDMSYRRYKAITLPLWCSLKPFRVSIVQSLYSLPEIVKRY